MTLRSELCLCFQARPKRVILIRDQFITVRLRFMLRGSSFLFLMK